MDRRVQTSLLLTLLLGAGLLSLVPTASATITADVATYANTEDCVDTTEDDNGNSVVDEEGRLHFTYQEKIGTTYTLYYAISEIDDQQSVATKVVISSGTSCRDPVWIYYDGGTHFVRVECGSTPTIRDSPDGGYTWNLVRTISSANYHSTGTPYNPCQVIFHSATSMSFLRTESCSGTDRVYIVETADSGATTTKWFGATCSTGTNLGTRATGPGVSFSGSPGQPHTVDYPDSNGRANSCQFTYNAGAAPTVTCTSVYVTGTQVGRGDVAVKSNGDRYSVQFVAGTGGAGTYDLALYKLANGGTAATFQHRLTLGENLASTSAPKPELYLNGDTLYVSYIDNDDTQRKFAKYEGAANPTFESPGIGAVDRAGIGRNAGYSGYHFTASGALFLLAHDSSATVAAGQLQAIQLTGTIFDGGTEAAQAATASVTGLVAFDIDPSGTTAIARTNNGDYVRTWSAQGLGSPAASIETNCDSQITAAVSASSSNVVYLDCNDAGASDDQLSIRSSALGNPLTPTDCGSGAYVDFDSWNEGDYDESDTTFLSDIGFYSVDWDVAADGTCVAYAAVVIATVDGRIGILSGSFSSIPAFQNKQAAMVQYAPATTPVFQLCGQVFEDTDADTDSDFYVLATDSASATVAYEWNLATLAGTSTLTTRATLGGQLGSALSVDCSATNNATAPVIMYSGGATRGINLATGTQAWSRTDLDADVTAGPRANAVAVSLDGLWGAVATTDGTTHILAMANGTTLGEITTPEGDLITVKLDSTGQNLWIATSTTIARYEITELTTGEPVQTCLFCEGGVFNPPASSSSGTSTCSVFCTNAETAPDGFTATSFNALLGVLMVAGIGGGFYFIDRRSNHAHVFGAVGAFVGFCLAYFFGLFPLWVVLLLVLGAAAILVLKLRGG